MSPPEPAAQPEAQSSSTPKSSSTDKDEACQTLSPSSPSAPRSQGQQSSQKAPFEARQEELGVGEEQTGKAIPPEIVNKPSVGRKGGSRFKAQKAALTLTPEALERVRSLLDSAGGPRLLRIGVRNKGCAGMSYHLEYVTPEQAGKFDERVQQDGVEVLVDSKALFSIIGSEMDWQEDRLSAKFVFNNPNVVEACGCGESVRFG